MMPSQANFEFQKCRQSFRSIIRISSLTWLLLHHRVLFMSMVILIGNGLSAFEIPNSSNSSSVRNVVEDSAEYGLHSNSIFLTDDRALHSDSISLDLANKEETENRQSRSEQGGMSMILNRIHTFRYYQWVCMFYVLLTIHYFFSRLLRTNCCG